LREFVGGELMFLFELFSCPVDFRREQY